MMSHSSRCTCLLLLLQTFYGSLESRTTWVSWYQKKHSPTHTNRGHQSSLICFLDLLRSVASSLFNLRAWQSFSTISLQVFFGLPLVLFCCSTKIMQSNPSLFLKILTLYTELFSCSLMQHIHLTILISACWSATSFSFLMGNILHRTQLLYNLPLTSHTHTQPFYGSLDFV